MRVIKNFQVGNCLVSVFVWNEKYIIKFEQDELEQTYKIRMIDIISEDDLIGTLQEAAFITKIEARFEAMRQDWYEHVLF